MAVGQKTKRRNSEKRKEHSRDAARCRRSREAEVFLHLSKEIPLSYDLVKVLDKTSMIRLTIAYLKLQTLFSDARHESNALGKTVVGQFERKFEQFCQKALDGFVMVVAGGGDILYVTDNIAGFLGLTQVDVMGQSIFDLTHPCDHDELRDMIGSKGHQPSDDNHRVAFIRMKSTITSRGRNVNIKSASYKVISCTGHLKRKHWNSGVEEEEKEGEAPFVVVIGRMISHPSNVDAALDGSTFVSRHSLDMKFTECDERIHDLIGYTVGDVIGKSMYSYYHALDSETLERAYRTLFYKGQASTGLYRFLAHHGGYIWVDTHATIVNNAVTDKPEHIVCIHYVVSGVEGQDTVFDVVQMSSGVCLPVKSGIVEKEEEDKEDLAIEILARSCLDDEDDNDQSCIQFATEEILAQVVREKQDSELFSHNHSLYSANRTMMERTNDEKLSDEVGDENDNEPGMTKNFSNFSLTSFLDKMDDSLETRAPYVSMDDLVFSSCDTPMSQSHDHGSHTSSMMNSDPLLSSVEHDGLLMTGSMPPPPLFTVDLTDIKMDLPPQKSFGAKRSCTGTDPCSLPSKAPRLELDSEPPSYLETRDFASPVSSATGHIPTVTAGQANPPRTIALPVQQSGAEQVKFLQRVTELYNKDYGEREPEMPVTTVYLVLNKKKQPDPVAIAPNLATSEAGLQSNEGVTIYRPALNPSQVQFLEQVKVANQLAVVNDKNDVAGGGKLFLDVARPDGKLLRMASKNNISLASLVSANGPTSVISAMSADSPTSVGMTAVDSGIMHGIPSHSYGIMTGSQMDVSKSCIQQVGKPQDPVLNSTGNKAIHLISPSGKKTAFVFPTQKTPAVVRQPLSQGVSVVQNLQNRSCFTGGATGAGANHPPHLQVQDAIPSAVEKLTSKTLLSDAAFLKLAMMSGGVIRSVATGKDSGAGGSVILKAGGNGEQPSGKSFSQSWESAGVASSVTAGKMNAILASQGGLLTAQLQKPRTTVAVGNALQFDGHKMAVTKHSELQQVVPQRSEGGILSRPRNHENMGPICIEPLTSSYSDAIGSSVLKNLLMKGVDVNYGYRLENSSSHCISK